MSRPGDLTPRQARIVELCASGMNQTDIGLTLGLTRRQVGRALDSPFVRMALRRVRDDALADTVRRLNVGSSEMLDLLLAVARDPETPAGVRIRCAEMWLNVQFRADELVDLVERVAELEKVSNETKSNTTN